jgi:hypothetical protein
LKIGRELADECPGAFVLQIVNFDTFAEAMTNKLLTEVSQHIQAP